MADHPAKLELLTRPAGETGFQTFEIDSQHAYCSYKPQRLPETEWEVTAQPTGADGARHFVLRNLRQDNYLLLNSKEYFLWECFDGRHSLEEIARAFHLTFGAFDYTLIRHLLAKLYNCGVIERQSVIDFRSSPTDASRRRLNRAFSWGLRRLRGLSFRIPHADRVCTILYNHGGFLLFYPLSFWASVALAVFALMLALQPGPTTANFAYFIKTRPFLLSGVMLGTALLVSVLHVLVHALACKAYGRRVRELGFFLLQGIVPTFYADVTDIFMSTRRVRVTVDMAGPMVEVVLGSAAILGACATGDGLGPALLFGIGITLWESAVINLYPFNFLEMDGYNIVADLLAVPMLRQQALALIPNLPQRLRHVRTIERGEWLQIGYVALCLISVTVYLYAHVDAIRALLHLS
jgi:putative peptide zinc metalloprotease protein